MWLDKSTVVVMSVEANEGEHSYLGCILEVEASEGEHSYSGYIDTGVSVEGPIAPGAFSHECTILF